jgi:PAS domain S-box-containing protein
MLEAVVANANDVVMVTDAEPLARPGPRIVHVNDAFERMTGYTPDEAIGETPRFLQGPGTDPGSLARIREALQRGEPVREELLNYRKDGSPFWVEVNIVPVRDAAGNLKHWASIQRETTSRREAEEEIRRLSAERRDSQQRIERLLRDLPDMAWIKDRDGRYLAANEAFAQAVRLAPKVVAGKADADLFGPAVASRMRHSDRWVLERLECLRVEEEIPLREGASLQVETIRSPYHGEDGEVVGTVGIARDITARRRGERALRESEARLASIISIAADAIVSVDEEQRITIFNLGAEQTFGYSADEVLGKPLDLLIPEAVREIHRRHFEEFGRSPVQARRMGERGRVTGRRRSGEIFPADASISRVDVDGTKIYTAVLRDITQDVRAEEALRQANENFAALIAASPLAVITLDLEGRVEIWNPAAESIFGWPQQEVIGRPLPIVPDDRHDEFERELEATRQGGVTSGVETEGLHRDGSRVAVSISTAALRSPTGEVHGEVKLIRDVTERRRAEEVQRRLTAILEATPDMVSTADPLGRILFLNRAGRKLLGIEDEDLSDRLITGFHPDWAASLILREAIPTALRRGSWSGETAVLRTDGREVPVLQSIIAHPDLSGEVEYLSTVVRDITGRKRIEEIQRFLSEASHTLSGSLEYGEVLSRVTDLIVPRMADYCIVDIVGEEGEIRREAVVHSDPERQQRLERLQEFPPSETESLGASRVLRTGEPELIPDVTEVWIRAVSRTEEHLELLRSLDPGSELIVPLRARGRVIGSLTFTYAESGRHYRERDIPLAEDLAGRAALAIDNTHLYRSAREATRTRDEVLRVVAHDLRNPLNTILLSTGLLLETLAPEHGEQITKQLDVIKRSTERANHLIGDLLDVARMEAGRLTVEREPIETIRLIQEVLDLHRVQIEQAGLDLVVDVDDGLPTVLVDRDRLLQVFSNLIGNAVKFTPAGEEITISAKPAEGEVVFRVSDTGPGIPAEEQANLFAPFWQAKPGTREGAGLGLTISRGIIEAHEGRIWAESREGAGTTFHFALPTADPVSKPAAGGEAG